METLTMTTLIANGWDMDEISLPAYKIACFRIIINGIIIAVSLYKLLREKKETVLMNYVFVIFAVVFDLLRNILYRKSFDNGKGVWFLNLVFHTLVWLSCLNIFKSLPPAVQYNVPNFSTKVRNEGKLYMYATFGWATLSACIGFCMATLPPQYRIDPRLHNIKFVHYEGDLTLPIFLGFPMFALFVNVIFVDLYLLLFTSYKYYLKRMPNAVGSITAFGIFVIIPVVIDAIQFILALFEYPLTANQAVLGLIFNFTFNDCFLYTALIVVLSCSDTWVFPTKSIYL